jgi:chromosome segregation ATPase
LIEAAMLFALGFLCAALLALAAVPALSRRADRLARKRAEAAFPLSLAEIAADRDHLRAELAVRMRSAEQEAEKGFAARAGAMQEVGRRDMEIGQLRRDRAERDDRIARLDAELAQTRGQLDETRTALETERGGHAATTATLEKRIADLAALEQSLAETRQALTGTGADLDERSGELARERETVGRIEAALAEREAELTKQRDEHERLRLAQVEDRTQIMVLQSERDEFGDRLAVTEERLSRSEVALAAMTAEREGERLRANALAARAEQAEAGLAAADARGSLAANEAQQASRLLEQERAEHKQAHERIDSLEGWLVEAQHALATSRREHEKEIATVTGSEQDREARIAALHAELQTLEGALEQARSDGMEAKRELAALRKSTAAQGGNMALRQEIIRLADRLMSQPTGRDAAE